MTRRVFFHLLISLTLFVHSSCLYAMGTSVSHKLVPLRILVEDSTKSISLRIKGHYKIVDFESGEVLREERNLRKTALSIEDINSEGIRILPERGGTNPG